MEHVAYRVSILMPSLNEERTIQRCVLQAYKFLTESRIEGEVLVADNASTDASAKLAKEAGARVINIPVRGYGAALSAGIAAAQYEYILMLDADGSYDAMEGQDFLKRLDAGADLVIGNRFLGNIEAGAMPWLHRYIGNPFLSALGRKLARVEIGDFHCGMRAFRKGQLEKLCLRTTQMEFASEMIMKAAKAGMSITEVPCNLYRDGRNGKSHLRTFRDGIRHAVCMWKNRRL